MRIRQANWNIVDSGAASRFFKHPCTLRWYFGWAFMTVVVQQRRKQDGLQRDGCAVTLSESEDVFVRQIGVWREKVEVEVYVHWPSMKTI